VQRELTDQRIDSPQAQSHLRMVFQILPHEAVFASAGLQTNRANVIGRILFWPVRAGPESCARPPGHIGDRALDTAFRCAARLFRRDAATVASKAESGWSGLIFDAMPVVLLA